jgi:hypothetical protein
MTYLVQIDDEIREATPEEIAEIEARIAAKEAEEQAKQEAEIKRKALLDRLGITAEEARLLLS